MAAPVMTTAVRARLCLVQLPNLNLQQSEFNSLQLQNECDLVAYDISGKGADRDLQQ